MGTKASKNSQTEHLDPAEKECRKLACEIQKCMQERGYNACQDVVKEYEQCVDAARRRHEGGGAGRDH